MGPRNALHGLDNFLQKLVEPLARALELPHLPANFPLLAYSALGFTFVHVVVAPILSRIVAPKSYGALKGRRARNNWNIHIVSFVNAVVVVALAARVLRQPALTKDRAFGWTQAAETANAVALGYFLWDTIDAIVNFTDLGFVLHGMACTVTYIITFAPCFQYFSCRFLLWELSTPFLNIHWFLDKTGRTGSTFQLVNGICLLSTFFGARIVYGWYISIAFWRTMFSAPVRHTLPTSYAVIFLVGHTTLTLLNLIWLGKMIRALRRRFDDDDDKDSLERQPLLGGGVGVAPSQNPTNSPNLRPASPPIHNAAYGHTEPATDGVLNASPLTGTSPPPALPQSAGEDPPRNWRGTDPAAGAA